MPLTKEEIKEIAIRTAEEVIERLHDIPDLALHVAEHEVLGSARVIDKAKAEDPNIPGKCFGYDTDEYCWKPGYLGLISSKKNPEQMATVKIKIPAGAGTAERFKKLTGAIGTAHKEWERKGEGLKGWWEEVGKSLGEHKVEL